MRLCLLLVFISGISGIKKLTSMIGRKQAAGVRGQLLCGTLPMENATVKLWDEDHVPDPDDLLDEVRTNETGHFEVSGTQNEITDIDPRLNLYHNCKTKSGCKRKVTFYIPDEYITLGPKAEKWFELGSLNMEIITKGEYTQCT